MIVAPRKVASTLFARARRQAFVPPSLRQGPSQWDRAAVEGRCWRAAYSSASEPKTIIINGKTYPTDTWFNISSTVASLTPRKLHLQKDHPVYITRQIIESVFPGPTFRTYNTLDPVVSTHENFDSLGFPPDHPGRAKTDTYYINSTTLLRTHTSAHEAALFKAGESRGYLISADVYRRDEVDKSHYPVFHQMEGARVWSRKDHGQNLVKAIWEDVERLPKHDMKVEDPNPPFHPERNPLQEKHSAEEAEAVGAHLKESLEMMVFEIFTRVKASHAKASLPQEKEEPLRVRWVEAFFPFTSPSWELEVFYQGDWLEVLGCGVSQQKILDDAGVPEKIGWAFGIGLDRIAMLLFQIPDIRLFWSKDQRFLSQFTGISNDLTKLKPFVPFSKHPACYKDVSFWLARTSSAAGGNDKQVGAQDWHENDLMEIVRDVCGDAVEDVVCTDTFTHPKTGRKSLCYRINYRSLERTLTNEEANVMHERVRRLLVERFGVELR